MKCTFFHATAIDCNNGGRLDRSSCVCVCSEPWSGPTCDACVAEGNFISASVYVELVAHF